jgi:hypothetical protein
MSGAMHPLPQYAFMAWCLVKAQGQLYLYLTVTGDNFLAMVGHTVSVGTVFQLHDAPRNVAPRSCLSGQEVS